MEVRVSSDLPEGLSEAFRMRTHNRRAGVIVQVQTVTVTEQIGALIRLYAVYLHAVLLFLRRPRLHGPCWKCHNYFLIDNTFTARSQPA